MAIRNGDILLQDYTAEVNKVERTYGFVESLGLHDNRYLNTTTATVDVVTDYSRLPEAKLRGGERNSVQSENVITRSFNVPFFPLDGQVTPTDIQNLRQWGTEDMPQSVDDAIMRIMDRLRRYQGNLVEKSLVEAIKGSTYGYKGGELGYATQFNVTPKTEIAFDLTNTASVPMTQISEAYGYILDNVNDGSANVDVIAICGTGYFDKLIANSKVSTAWASYFQSQQPLRTGQQNGAVRGRSFEYGGVTFYEYRGSIGGTSLIGAEKVYFMPRGLADMLLVHYAPGDLVDEANQMAQELYMIVKKDYRKVSIESESAILTVNTRPELVVTGNSGS